MQSTTIEDFSTLAEARNEIVRLRAEVARLERELATALRGASPVHDGPPAASTASAPPAAPLPARTPTIDDTTAEDAYWQTVFAGARQERQAQAASISTASPLMEVLTGSDEAAAHHLNELRTAIQRLRDERTQVAVQFRKLTQEPLGAFQEPPAAPQPNEAPVAVRDQVTIDAPPAEHLPIEGAIGDAASLASEPVATTTESAPQAVPRAATGSVASIGLSERDQSFAGGDAIEAISFPGDEADLEDSRASRRFIIAAGVIAVLAAGVAAAIWFSRHPAPGLTPPSESAPVVQESSPVAPAAPAPSASEAATPEDAATTPDSQAGQIPAVPPAAAAPAGAAGADGVAAGVSTGLGRVDLLTSREVWLRVVVDGQTVTSDLIAGERILSFDVTREILVRAGDAGAVRVVIDGTTLGVLGADGEVLTRTFDVTDEPSPR